ncbi:hypothetical protein [Klebsiella sp. CN_Kp109]
MINEIIQGFKKLGRQKKNKEIISSRSKAFSRLQWIAKNEHDDT